MLLKSLKLKDFRQFKGEQTIVFSDDPEKNVTVIMGDNGTGKTTLAQAFTWCLYGETDFDDKILLCKATLRDMLPGQTEKVRAELTLTHKGTEYIIVSEQQYRKTDKSDKPVEVAGQRGFTIMYKQGGQVEYVKQSQLDGRMKEILPFELARYFFFDGERITVMSKRLSQGKGDEFARAVRSLLGLDAFTSAIDHLKKTIKDYDKKYDARSDSKIEDYTNQISNFEQTIEPIEMRLSEIADEEVLVTERIGDLQAAIEKNKKSEELAEREKKLISRRDALIVQKGRNITGLLSALKRAPAYFAKKMMRDSLQQLTKTGKTDKSVPFVNAETIKYLIERGRCICGAEVCTGTDACNTLTELFSYVPPKSIGDSIADFREKCKERVRISESMFDDFEAKYADVCACDSEYAEVLQDIADVGKQLLGMDDVGKLQADRKRYETNLRGLHMEKSDCERRMGGLETECKRVETERDKLTLKDDNNRRVTIYKAYAQYMYNTLLEQYAEEERKIREELEETVNDIFHSLFDEGFMLELSERYDVNVILSDFGGSSETSTAQNISIIFAFIAGVIKMARESQKEENGLLVTEPYPFVMDAPLSSFDKKRIENVCDVLPRIAEQVIIFIKDTDGEIAEEHLGNRIGRRLTFHAPNNSKTETYVS